MGQRKQEEEEEKSPSGKKHWDVQLESTIGKYQRFSSSISCFFPFLFRSFLQKSLSSFLKQKKQQEKDAFGCLDADTWMLCAV